MAYKTIFAVISLIFLLPGCSSNQNNINRDVNQVPVENKSTQEIQDNRLLQTALDGNKPEVMRLLEEGVDVNLRDMDGRTALMYASFNGHTDIVNELLKKGAEVNLRDNYGRTPLMFASSGPFHETVKLLLENRADPDMVDGEEHYTAIMYAAAEGHLDVVKILLDSNVDPTIKDIDGDDAATFALNNDHKEVADMIQSFINEQNNPY